MPTVLTCKALLFDLDGTLIDSLPAVDRAWTALSLKHGLIPSEVLTQVHGRRSIDSIRRVLPNVDAEVEDAFLRHLESTDMAGVTALPGAIQLLNALPRDKWAVVTSGTVDVALARLKATGVPEAGAYVFGGDVRHGKPAPDPFLLGARRLGFHPELCVGIEDTRPGIASVHAAGMKAVGIQVESDLQIRDLTELKVAIKGDLITLTSSRGSGREEGAG